MEKIKEFTANGISAVHIEHTPKISLFKTFDCGQCFRFEPLSLFGNKFEFGGVAHGRYVVFAQNHENELIIYNSTLDDYLTIWKKYLCLDVDYDKINSDITSTITSPHMKDAIEYGSGIRILAQGPWECIISFIISQNNNIPRIKKIVSAICEKYGKPISFMNKTYYAFPELDELAKASVEELFELKMGFRAKYIRDACDKLISGDAKIEYLMNEPDFESCVSHLCQIKGIGLKVASCALLFGFGKTEAFPIDVHIKRTLDKYFPEGFDYIALGKNAGIAQQYLFYHEKYKQST